MPLTPTQLTRYARNLAIRPIGLAGQEKLLASSVLVAGAGGLGSPAILYLAAAGVGTLAVADPDPVDLSNLQRQILHGLPDLGLPKVESARRGVARLNPDVKVVTYPHRLTREAVSAVVAAYDLVLDCTDNLPAKLALNDACVLLAKPFVYGGALALHGQVLTYTPGHACLRCAVDVPWQTDAAARHPDTAPTSRDAGILGAAAGVIGALQAAEAIKLLTGAGRPLTDTLLHVDLLRGRFRAERVRRDPRCPVCGRHPTITRP